ncbi:hypothetical protein HPB49_026637 [Dermacentor silvarum]|nr:hypothetical protein HPB49_026637 [Dermacentor silvarum]
MELQLQQLANAISKIYNAYRHEGRLENVPRGCRPRATTTDEDERVLNAAKRDPIVTAKEIRNDIGLNASTAVVASIAVFPRGNRSLQA